MTSHWSCIFGNGCQGVLTEEAPELVHGCCSYGAHASGAEGPGAGRQGREAARRRHLAVPQACEEEGHLGQGRQGRLPYPARRRRLHLPQPPRLQRPGPGCALHQLAERTGQHHSDLKPEVCWQLPIRNIEEYDEDADDGIVYHRLTEFARHGWGEGGEEFAWWCTEEPAAFVGRAAVYRSLEPELRKMCGDELFEMIAEYLDERLAAGTRARGPPVGGTRGARADPDRSQRLSPERLIAMAGRHGRRAGRGSRGGAGRRWWTCSRRSRSTTGSGPRRRGAGTSATRSPTSRTPTSSRSTPALDGPRALATVAATLRVVRGPDAARGAARAGG